MIRAIKVLTRTELTNKSGWKMSKVATYENGVEVAIPINKDGSIKWLDDSLFMKKA